MSGRENSAKLSCGVVAVQLPNPLFFQINGYFSKNIAKKTKPYMCTKKIKSNFLQILPHQPAGGVVQGAVRFVSA